MNRPDFSIVTPSFNQLDYLRRCHASIINQNNVSVEHLVMDGGSTDGTLEWLKSRNDLIWVSEPDNGMYDAINKGWSRSTGAILAWLNCDEQYLENSLEKVLSALGRLKKIDFAYGDTILVRPDGRPISYRKAIPLRLLYLNASHLYVHSSSLFLRRQIFDHGLMFDPRLKTAGDLEWLIRVLRAGYRGRLLNECLSAFTITGSNLDDSVTATREKAHLLSLQPHWFMPLRKVITMARWFEKFVRGGYSSRRHFRYRIIDNDGDRQTFIADNLGFHWATKT